jgi:hypothetical protein
MGEQVIHHVAIGRPLYYHALGKHLYWQGDSSRAELPSPMGPYDHAVFTRAHNGWASGLCTWDRFIKNTHEVLGPLYTRTAEALIERCEIVDGRSLVRKTTYDNGAWSLVNGDDQPYDLVSPLGKLVRLPPFGFLIETTTFVAFHALSWGGLTYDRPVLFTLTALDGLPLDRSQSVRVFHGFGDARLPWRKSVFCVQREAVL